MIILGNRPRTVKESSGNFYCPECNDYKTCSFKKVKNYFTLYFIPLFPISDLGEYIECSNCKFKYKENECSQKSLPRQYWDSYLRKHL